MARATPAYRPAARDGISASRVAVLPGPWTTVAQFLAARLRPGIDWPARLAQGDVLDALGRPLAPDAPCVPGSVRNDGAPPEAGAVPARTRLAESIVPLGPIDVPATAIPLRA